MKPYAFLQIEEKFPEIDFVGLSESAENRDNIIVKHKYPHDEDRQKELHKREIL